MSKRTNGLHSHENHNFCWCECTSQCLQGNFCSKMMKCAPFVMTLPFLELSDWSPGKVNTIDATLARGVSCILKLRCCCQETGVASFHNKHLDKLILSKCLKEKVNSSASRLTWVILFLLIMTFCWSHRSSSRSRRLTDTVGRFLKLI